MNYTNVFAPVSTQVMQMLTAVLPIALGIFAIIIAIRLGARVVKSFTTEDEDDDDE